LEDLSDGSSKPFQSTYYDDRMRASPALLRARAPYLIKNTITGFAICSLVIGICTLQ
jgi:cytochrome c oxidase assembly factor 3